MKRLVRFTVLCLLFESVLFSAHAAFTSFYVFGDGVCTTTNNSFPGTNYYGLRRTNGRVWVEVLAQWQGLAYDSNKNWSYYGQDSAILVTNVSNFTAPSDANTALFAIWVNDADFVDDMGKYTPYASNNLAAWTNAINRSLTNHFKVITNLYYAKGVRTLVMPNAVDITEIPQYDLNPAPARSFVRQRVVSFNSAFTALLSNTVASLPGLTIYEPDVFSLLDNVVTNSAYYGLTNALYNGASTDVVEDDTLKDKSLNGPGANYIFWDATDPTAKLHMVIANAAQQLMSPVQITKITALSGSNQLDVVNVPVGRAGFVDGSADLLTWTAAQSTDTNNAIQSIFVSTSGPQQFYRLRFPLVWTWP